MDEKTLGRFTAGLPIPSLTPLQVRLAGEIVRLQQLADEQATRAADADGAVWLACLDLANAMSAAGIERNADGEPVPSYDYDEPGARDAYEAQRAPWDAAETWILRTGSGTGSARDLAICYLGRILGLSLDWRDICGRVLDEQREAMAAAILDGPQPARLPSGFWRIFITYREAAANAWQQHGARRARRA